ncbi:carbon monoxide dehydrogenase [Nocardioides sp. dk4132]|uniref:SRPBCC family protein n=1 Tax=unclassified Nocardioides TaxID=2615069 RepID=UPI001294FD84|nr:MULTISPECIES: SRPBCC domain-containing protein [unclassified Nocardioides]MQW75617.1 carbon monoxide dehydrogenase [Nocardioides sp. dk4132]QGA08516.1 carbon monoxide dehydrogenase [Nocardioides sp. dk884]
MKIAGSNVIAAPVEKVWDSLLDPAVLVATIPGCERLEATGENAYDMTVSAGVGAIKGTYTGTCRLSDLEQHQSLTMHLRGAGAPGTVDAAVAVRFAAVDGGTEVAYEADATVGGMVGGVGQRMLTSVSKRMAAEFFGNVEKAITSGLPAAAPAAVPAAAAPAEPGAPAPAAPAAQPGVFTAPAKAAASGSTEEFVKGIGVGAGLVLVGVVAGALLGRRR